MQKVLLIQYFFILLRKIMSMIPKVSVIFTIYKREKYIEECVRSLFD